MRRYCVYVAAVILLALPLLLLSWLVPRATGDHGNPRDEAIASGRTPAPNQVQFQPAAVAPASEPPATEPNQRSGEADAAGQSSTEAFCPLCGPERDLRPSSPPQRGADVGELQERLSKLGYYRGPQDWTYNPQLVAAVRAFQRDHGLDEDGVVDEAVWYALDNHREAAFVALAAPTGEPLIVIDIDRRNLSLYFDGTLYATFPVAVGKPESPTPIGEWHIAAKDRNWGTGFGSRFMKLDVPWGMYGIHGTNKPWSIGRAMSGGCVRMYNRHVERLYDLVEVGTKVRIVGTLHVRRLCRGDRGADVMEVQAALAEAGYFESAIDGFFGPETERALLKFQRENGLQPNGQVDRATYDALGL